MQLKQLVFSLIIGSLSATAQIDQRNDILKPGSDIYADVTTAINTRFHQLDSAQSFSVNENGIIFIKFSVNRGRIVDLNFMLPGLPFIKTAISEVMLSMPSEKLLGFKSFEKSVFILPVVYRFEINGGKYADRNATEIFQKMPSLNELSKEENMMKTFSSFLNIKNTSDEIGVKCFLLTPLEINRPRI